MSLGFNSVHFVGIGGIGVSALAKYYLSRGAAVSGSDLVSTEITKELERLGVKIFIGEHKKSNLPPETDKVIYTAAVSPKNPELREAKKRNKKLQSYAQALGDLSRLYTTITVSGSHGKSTTTALASLVLEEGYCDPTVIIGTKVKEFGNTNFRPGFGSHLLLEADEWNKSFLNYFPQIAIFTNIDAEHLDTFKSAEGVEETFRKFMARVPQNGIIIANRDDEKLRKIAGKIKKRVIWYSLSDPEAKYLRKYLKIPGEHNTSNALAAWKLGRVLGIHEPAILKALSRFRGSWRRFEFRGFLNGAHIFDDYGHHPREITSTIAAARGRFPFRRIWCVYQPHQFQRLSYLWDDFIKAFDLADKICLLPVYDVVGREAKKAKISVNSLKLSKELARRGKNVQHLASFAKTKEYLRSHTRPGDVILMMGAGDIYTLTPQLLT